MKKFKGSKSYLILKMRKTNTKEDLVIFQNGSDLAKRSIERIIKKIFETQ